MIAYSTRLRDLFQRMRKDERASIAQAATACLHKDNIEAVGHNVAKVVGASGPSMQVLRALDAQGALSGDWTVTEATIDANGRIGVLVFSGDEDSACDLVSKLMVVHGVQAA